MNRFVLFLLILFICYSFNACSSQNDSLQEPKSESVAKNLTLKNSVDAALQQESSFECDYMGMERPGDVPTKFAPGIISTKADDSCFDISISGKEIVFTRDGKIFFTTQEENGRWSQPSSLSFSGGETSFSPDGTKIYFNSRIHFPGAVVPLNVWVSQKVNGQWANPYHFSRPVINQTVHAPSVSSNGNIYASGIIRLKFVSGEYQPVENLTPNIKGYHPFVSPDESFIIFDKRPPSRGNAADLFITFQKPDTTWTEPVPLGSNINSPAMETNAFVTPDCKYMFFTRNFDVYWVKADFIGLLKSQVLK